MSTTDPTTLAIHSAICEDSIEECLDFGGMCVKAARAVPVAWHHTPEPEGVEVVNDDTDNEGEDQNRWARTNNGTGWKGYKNGGSVYLEWEELERRWGPITW